MAFLLAQSLTVTKTDVCNPDVTSSPGSSSERSIEIFSQSQALECGRILLKFIQSHALTDDVQEWGRKHPQSAEQTGRWLSHVLSVSMIIHSYIML
jgi:hypothetical protein